MVSIPINGYIGRDQYYTTDQIQYIKNGKLGTALLNGVYLDMYLACQQPTNKRRLDTVLSNRY